jgi:hypothetical protein
MSDRRVAAPIKDGPKGRRSGPIVSGSSDRPLAEILAHFGSPAATAPIVAHYFGNSRCGGQNLAGGLSLVLCTTPGEATMVFLTSDSLRLAKKTEDEAPSGERRDWQFIEGRRPPQNLLSKGFQVV